MNGKDNDLRTTEQNYNMIDSIPNNAPLPVPQAWEDEPPKDRVIPPPAKHRGRDREDR